MSEFKCICCREAGCDICFIVLILGFDKHFGVELTFSLNFHAVFV